jgi:hypothetical protein
MTKGAGAAFASVPLLPAVPGAPPGDGLPEAPGWSVEEEGVPVFPHPADKNSANNTTT